MVLDLNEKSFLHTVWFVDAPQAGCNILAAVFRKEDGSPWEARYRFRYDTDNSVSEYALTTEGKTADEILKAMTRVLSLAAMSSGGEVYRVSVQGGPDRALALLSEQPWFHVQKEGTARS